MASSLSSSSSSSVILESKYDVFLSFRGEDTRDNFTSHLYSAFCRKKILTFIDDGLKRGDDISPALLKAIEESSISVVIFSKHYASSKWCLDELVKILECKKMNGQMVIPVFYQVIPSDIRNQTGSFKDAFVKHEERFKEVTGKVQKWKDALTEAANLSGWDSMVIRTESKLVDEIVRDVLKKLDAISAPSNCEGLVGIDLKVEHIKSLLCIGSLDFRVVGLWGMGGIGKTTIAETVYNQIRGQFEGCCFIRNIREDSAKTSDGLVRLKEQLICQILQERNLNIGTLNTISTSIKRRVQHTKFLVVLDDVSNLEQLKVLTGGIDQFGPGSRVVITTRDKQLLCNFKGYNIYEVKELNYQQALQLFYSCAFKENCPPNDLLQLSKKIVDYAKGNPLALKVLGSSLCQKSKLDWESALHKLNKISNLEIYNVLKTSYDALDHEVQRIFLDIASFFKGDHRNHAIRILDGCYLSVSFGLSVLIDKSLITISNKNKLEMHDLLQEMGREIICQENVKDPSKRSRLWYFKDVYCVLRDKKGTESIEGIFLNMAKIRDMQLSSGAFAEMSNLRLLKFYNSEFHKENVNISKVHLPQGLKFLPNELRYFHWDGYPSKTLPSRFSLENLVELNLQESNIEQLWKGSQYPCKLKVINLRGSQSLTRIPDLSHATDLNVINLEGCRSLVDVHSSIQSLNNLHYLSLYGCANLQGFSCNINFKSLKFLNLCRCINLKRFPLISGTIEHLDLSWTAIEEVPSSIKDLNKLRILMLRYCKSLKSFASNIHFRSLVRLDLTNCINLTKFPQISGDIYNLDLSGTAIEEVPPSIGCLTKLVFLILRKCTRLKTLPSSICKLKSLEWLSLSNCSKLESFPEILEEMESLAYLELYGATTIKELPSSIENLKRLTMLDLGNCKNLESLPARMNQLSQLQYLYLSNCSKLQSLTELPLSLRGLEVCNCLQLRSLPELPLSLICLEVYNCPQLRSLPELPLSLIGLEVYNSPQLHSLLELPSSSLEEVDASDLKIVPDLNQNSKDILADASLRLQHMVTALLRYRGEVIFVEAVRAIKFCLPGSEIPNWVSYRSLGSSLTIELPRHWFSRRFIGFALSVVIGFEKSYDGNELRVMCDYSFETNGGDKVNFWCVLRAVSSEINLKYEDDNDVLINSDHVLIRCDPDPCFDARLLNGDYTVGTFKFRPSNVVKYCGVCPLYGEPNMTRPMGSIPTFP